MPKCKKCGLEKDLSQFRVVRDSRSGHRSECLSCGALDMKNRREQDPLRAKAIADKSKAKNKEKVLAASRAWFARMSPDERKEYYRKWREGRKGILAQKRREHRQKNLAHVRAIQREAARRRKISHGEQVRAMHKNWRERNIEHIRNYDKKYREANPLVARLKHLRRSERIRNSGPRPSKTEIEAIFARQKGRCAHPWCKQKLDTKFHVDHIIPVVIGGKSDRRNLQILCPPCNLKKGQKHPVEYAARHGWLV
jgi:5-methylcytosine-specific restriction endonuclease McrA